MKCPVCKKDCSATDTSCTNCGFDQINKEFINQDELLRWMEETVLPCQKVYRTMFAKVNEKVILHYMQPILKTIIGITMKF